MVFDLFLGDLKGLLKITHHDHHLRGSRNQEKKERAEYYSGENGMYFEDWGSTYKGYKKSGDMSVSRAKKCTEYFKKLEALEKSIVED